MDKNNLIATFIKAGETTISNYLLENYQAIGMTNEQLLVYLQLKKVLGYNSELPDLGLIAKNMHLTKNAVANCLQTMVKNGLAEIKTVPNGLGQRVEHLTFDGLYQKLLQLDVKPAITANKNDKQAEQVTRQEVFATIESEFRRPLSTFELQTISKWLDEEKYDPEMIMLALKEAVLNNVYNFRYIEQILVNWRKKNIQTEIDVAQHRAERQQKMNSKVNTDNIRIRNIPYIDIMDLDE